MSFAKPKAPPRSQGPKELPPRTVAVPFKRRSKPSSPDEFDFPEMTEEDCERLERAALERLEASAAALRVVPKPPSQRRPPLRPTTGSFRPSQSSTTSAASTSRRRTNSSADPPRSLPKLAPSPPPAPKPVEVLHISSSDNDTSSDDDAWIFQVSLSASHAVVGPPLAPLCPSRNDTIIPDSEEEALPLSPAVAGPSRKVSTADKSFESPVVFKRPAVARKKILVVHSSSPEVSIAGPSRARMAVPVNATMGEALILDSPSTELPLKRLRRGRTAVDNDEEEEGDLEPAPPISTRRRRRWSKGKGKRKRKNLTEHEVVHSNLFDFEAVNSEAEETEASSEDYDSEDSDDRNFILSQGGDDADSPGQAKFRAESLLTQAPGFHRSPVRPGAFRMSRGVNYRPATPGTPDSMDQWSYDSFCVPDDEEIMYDTSSQGAPSVY